MSPVARLGNRRGRQGIGMERRSAKDRSNEIKLARTGEGTKPQARTGKDRREATRVDTNQNAAFSVSNVRYIVEARDVSETGAQICIRRGVVPTRGQIVTLQFMERHPIGAKVVWTRDKNVGLKFLQPIAELPDALHFEDLGAEYFRAILRFQRIAS